MIKMKKIDIHCHSTNRIVLDASEPNATTEKIVEKMREYEIEKTVLLATYFPHKHSGISNFRMLHWANAHPGKFFVLGSLDFENYFYQGINELEELAKNSLIKGIKIYTTYQHIDFPSTKIDLIAEIAKKYSLPLMFHGGESYSSLRKTGKPVVANLVMPSQLEYLAKEGNKIILSHLCSPYFDELIKVAKRNENVYSDVSGLIDSRYDRHEIPETIEQIKKFLYECGPEKLFFGTDFPIQTHEDSIYFVEESMKNFSEEDKKKVYYNNAHKLLRINESFKNKFTGSFVESQIA